MKILKVIKTHTSEFPVPLIATKGDIVEGMERETEFEGWLWCKNSHDVHSWVPKTYLGPTSESGQFQFLQDYTSQELTIDAGQEVIVLDQESGWAWARTTLGEEGWIPLVNLEELKDKPDSIPDLAK
ncbi:MAG: SH3 domain-containing protein [Candidatus Thorarchaeota archaeon]